MANPIKIPGYKPYMSNQVFIRKDGSNSAVLIPRYLKGHTPAQVIKLMKTINTKLKTHPPEKDNNLENAISKLTELFKSEISNTSKEFIGFVKSNIGMQYGFSEAIIVKYGIIPTRKIPPDITDVFWFDNKLEDKALLKKGLGERGQIDLAWDNGLPPKKDIYVLMKYQQSYSPKSDIFGANVPCNDEMKAVIDCVYKGIGTEEAVKQLPDLTKYIIQQNAYDIIIKLHQIQILNHIANIENKENTHIDDSHAGDPGEAMGGPILFPGFNINTPKNNKPN